MFLLLEQRRLSKATHAHFGYDKVCGGLAIPQKTILKNLMESVVSTGAKSSLAENKETY